jgi:hypothetical protein
VATAEPRTAADKKGCIYEGEDRPHGAEVSEEVRKLICLDGQWVDQDDLEPRGC